MTTTKDTIKQAAAALGRRGGSKTSEAKAKAARENGKKGGRGNKKEKPKMKKRVKQTVTALCLLAAMSACAPVEISTRIENRCGFELEVLEDGFNSVSVKDVRGLRPLTCEDPQVTSEWLATGSYVSLLEPGCAFDITRNAHSVTVGEEYAVDPDTEGCE